MTNSKSPDDGIDDPIEAMDDNSPFLPQRQQDGLPQRASDDGRDQLYQIFSIHMRKSDLRAFVLATAILTLAMLEDALFFGPKIKMLEHFVCGIVLNSGTSALDMSRILSAPSDERCVTEEVQSKLAVMRGWISLLDSLAAVILAYPLGFIADKFGRGRVLALSLFGMVLNQTAITVICLGRHRFNISMVLLPSAFMFIGGGIMIVRVISVSAVADISTEETRPITFNIVLGSVLLGSIIGPLIGRSLLDKSLWLPSLVGVSILLLLFPLVMALPKQKPRTGVTVGGELRQADHEPQIQISTAANPEAVIKVFIKESREIISKRGIMSTFVAIFSETIGGFSDILLPYVHTRFRWKLADTTSLLSMISAVNLLSCIVILPLLRNWLRQKYNLSGILSTYYITLICFIFMVTGTAAMFLAPGIGLFVGGLSTWAGGSEYRMFLFSSISTLVRPDQVARLYSLILIVDSFAMLLKGPMVQVIFAIALRSSGMMRALPFLVSTVLLIIGLIAVIWLRMAVRHM